MNLPIELIAYIGEKCDTPTLIRFSMCSHCMAELMEPELRRRARKLLLPELKRVLKERGETRCVLLCGAFNHNITLCRLCGERVNWNEFFFHVSTGQHRRAIEEVQCCNCPVHIGINFNRRR